MVARCTLEDRLIDPCGCALNDCLLDAGEVGSAQRNIVMEAFIAGSIEVEEAVRQMEIISSIEEAACPFGNRQLTA
jgi:hypothetical protein